MTSDMAASGMRRTCSTLHKRGNAPSIVGFARRTRSTCTRMIVSQRNLQKLQILCSMMDVFAVSEKD